MATSRHPLEQVVYQGRAGPPQEPPPMAWRRASVGAQPRSDQQQLMDLLQSGVLLSERPALIFSHCNLLSRTTGPGACGPHVPKEGPCRGASHLVSAHAARLTRPSTRAALPGGGALGTQTSVGDTRTPPHSTCCGLADTPPPRPRSRNGRGRLMVGPSRQAFSGQSQPSLPRHPPRKATATSLTCFRASFACRRRRRNWERCRNLQAPWRPCPRPPTAPCPTPLTSNRRHLRRCQWGGACWTRKRRSRCWRSCRHFCSETRRRFWGRCEKQTWAGRRGRGRGAWGGPRHSGLQSGLPNDQRNGGGHSPTLRDVHNRPRHPHRFEQN